MKTLICDMTEREANARLRVAKAARQLTEFPGSTRLA